MFATQLQLSWSSGLAYTQSNVQAYAPLQGGVYILARPGSEGKLYAFYVGQADNLDSRLKDHLLPQEENECIRKKVAVGDARFFFAKVEGQRDRDGAERALYDHYGPECNKIAPPGPAIAINFP
jgi:hypothetical protein